MKDNFGRLDYLKISIYGFALAALWSSLHSIVLPLRLLDVVAEAEKNTYLGLLTFAGLLLAMIVQPIAGAISDRSGFNWGRRRPYILIGSLLGVLLLPGIGLFQSYFALFIIYCLLQMTSNVAQGTYQAFIPDLVPQDRKGLASGVKSLLEIIGGIAIVRLIGYFMGKYVPGEGVIWLWLVLGVLAAVLLGAMLATIIMVKEPPGRKNEEQLSVWKTLSRSFKVDVRKDRDFIVFLVSRLLIFMALATIQTFTLFYLRDVIGLVNPATATADLLIAVGVGMLLAVYPAGRLSDRIGRRPVVISSGLVGAGGILVIFFSTSYGVVIAGGAIIGTATGAFMSSNWALATDLVPGGEEARYLGLTNMATAGGAALARLIGPVIDYFNRYGAGLGYQVMLGACFVYFMVGSLLLLKIRGRR
ncbi:MAG: MFS transporter [Dehalococcoidia bacterium]|nr:MAG: MFS transporter [Dehalococcoidia bacterium]